MCVATATNDFPAFQELASKPTQRNSFPITELVFEAMQNNSRMSFAQDQLQFSDEEEDENANNYLPAMKVIDLDDSSERSLCGSMSSLMDQFNMSMNLSDRTCSTRRSPPSAPRSPAAPKRSHRRQRNQAMTSGDFSKVVFSQLDMTL
ncbi:expressed unknown protein [Seminavis robusta]|uniref:Uncharacterized protein n=1 Tax=Seminavis robusta TaxID=568900 RepID=A0A9N8H7N1_9STRA|nr:expressed unknown protein [Seminavis robusta]|eukprot:Sro134_g063300.1 n/a (148) ;mRNA; r:10250-10693